MVSLQDLNDSQWPAEQIVFLEDFVAGTSPVEDSDVRAWQGDVDIAFNTSKLGVVLEHIQAHNPGNNRAEKAQEWLIKLADKHRVSIFADAVPMTDFISARDLKSWYLKMGYQRNGGDSVRYIPK